MKTSNSLRESVMKIVLLDAKTLGKITLDGLAQHGELIVYETSSTEEAQARIQDCDIVITNKTILNAQNLSTAKKLKLICIAATGTNNIDLNYCKNHHIAVTNVAGYSTPSVVQHTFAMLFYLIGQLKYYDDYVKNGAYCQADIFCHLERPYWEIAGKTWGIIGLGTIGEAVARAASVFGAKIIYYSASGQNQHPEFERVDLDTLCQQADIITIHAALNDKTKDLIHAAQFAQMKPQAVVLNVGRGGIVHEASAVDALNQKQIAAFGTDVLTQEPMQADSPFLHVLEPERLFITPHIAWASHEARVRLVHEIEQNITAFFAGTIRNRVV